MINTYTEIDGFSSHDEQGNILNKILDELSGKKLNIAEIGVYKGRMTFMWSSILKERKVKYNYYAIDHFLGSNEHEKNLDYYQITCDNLSSIIKKNLKIIKKDSSIASFDYPDDFFDIVYIDASHDYEAVKNDIEHWIKKVKKGGYICGDDYISGWSDVIRAVNEKFSPSDPNFFIVGKQQWGYKV